MTLPRKYLALAGKRLKTSIQVERAHGPEGREWTQEDEVEVTGTYHLGSPAKRDPGGNIVDPPEDPSIELDDPHDLTRAEREQAIEALMEEHAEQVGRLESEAEDRADGEREERKRNREASCAR